MTNIILKNKINIILMLCVFASCKHGSEEQIVFLKGNDTFKIDVYNPIHPLNTYESKISFDKEIKVVKVNGEKYKWDSNLIPSLLHDCHIANKRDNYFYLKSVIEIDDKLLKSQFPISNLRNYDLTIIYQKSKKNTFYVMDTTVKIEYTLFTK